MQREHEEFHQVVRSEGGEYLPLGYVGKVYRDDKESGAEEWQWRITKANSPEVVALGFAPTKPEAMRNFGIAFYGFSIASNPRQGRIIIDPSDFAPEKFEKYNDE